MPNTYTDDIDWKYELKEGDIIDSLDAENMWYRSTVLDTRTVLEESSSYDEGIPPKQIK